MSFGHFIGKENKVQKGKENWSKASQLVRGRASLGPTVPAVAATLPLQPTDREHSRCARSHTKQVMSRSVISSNPPDALWEWVKLSPFYRQMRYREVK